MLLNKVVVIVFPQFHLIQCIIHLFSFNCHSQQEFPSPFRFASTMGYQDCLGQLNLLLICLFVPRDVPRKKNSDLFCHYCVRFGTQVDREDVRVGQVVWQC